MPYTPKGYTTKLAVENYLLTDIDPSFDEQIDEWISAVETYIEHETGREFGIAEDPADPTDHVYDGDGTDTLTIDPADAVESIKLSPTGAAIAADQYYLYPANKTPKTKIKMRGMVFPKGNQNIVVNANYGLAQVPADIKFAATILVAGIVNNSASTDGEVSSYSIGPYSVTFKDEQQLKDFTKVSDILAYNKKYTF